MATRYAPGELYEYVKRAEQSNDYIEARQIADYWICVLCGSRREGSGHNPQPFSDGEKYRCCENCYDECVKWYYDPDHPKFTQREECDLLSRTLNGLREKRPFRFPAKRT